MWIILPLILVFLAIFILLKNRAQTDLKIFDPLAGAVNVNENPRDLNKKDYVLSLVNSYDPEPNWNPSKQTSTFNEPEVIASSAIMVDLDTGNVLFEKNSTQRKKIASLTKIMTGVLALEHLNFDDKVTVSQKASTIGENAMGISAGEIYTVEELMYGLVLNSGNDSAYALAEASAGNVETFVKWMNVKAGELGLKDTYFADPSGLDDSTYSTVSDLVKLTRYALKSPKFREVASTLEKELYGDDHKYLYLYNQTNLLSTYPGVRGVKTGYTEEAGLCLVTYALNDGKEVVGVVLNSIDRKGDMILMLDHSFSSLGVNVVHNLL